MSDSRRPPLREPDGLNFGGREPTSIDQEDV